nr:3-hydroxyacyl-CoA dehydrogenase family protein [Sphingomonas sp. CDS-1]
MRTAVVGAGLMGAEIALVQALAGYEVRLTDRDADSVNRGVARLENLLSKGIARGFYTEAQKTEALARILPTPGIEALGDCFYVTEAVFEDIKVKTAVLSALDAQCAPDCIIASNTSTIPISTLAACLSDARGQHFIGTHYFSPVSRMPLVEVIPGFETTAETRELAIRLCREAGKTPILVKDVPGFAVNRMLHAFIIEAVKLVEEGVASPADLDTACRLGLGHAMGPFELMDAVTSSLCIQAQEIMQDAYGERFRPPSLLKQRVAAGYVGGRNKPGWRKQKT